MLFNFVLNVQKCILNILQFYDSEAGIVLDLFLIFEQFEFRCSYKIFLIKKDCIGVGFFSLRQ